MLATTPAVVAGRQFGAPCSAQVLTAKKPVEARTGVTLSVMPSLGMCCARGDDARLPHPSRFSKGGDHTTKHHGEADIVQLVGNTYLIGEGKVCSS
jgi:hypothetical protein